LEESGQGFWPAN